ncbi:MAG: preprotein translocase subunit SecE [Clostridia bacterium]|nr:preprotein translocase subunit SecE [Clostridia bacterium]
MSKKREVVEETQQEEQAVKSNVQAKDKKENKDKKNKKEKKKDKQNGGLGRKTKETMSELKKVTWPTFGEVVKKTGIVIAFVLIFGLFFYGVNALLGWLVTLLA